jgi:elongation factor Ts
MAEITAALVKELRDMTGAGMMDCKKALSETGGDPEAARDWLRKKGMAAATKKAGRVAAEGLIGVSVDGTKGAIVEVNSETDFVARNETFQDFVRAVTGLALGAEGDLQGLAAAGYPGTGRPVSEELTQLIATIGENMTLRRTAALAVEEGAVAAYVHNQLAPGLGKIGVLVALDSGGDPAALAQLGKQLAMHVAAASPEAIDRAGVDPGALDREREVLAVYEEVCLLEQTFVIDNETKVSKVLEQAGKDLGAPVRIAGFERFQLGEGIERD